VAGPVVAWIVGAAEGAAVVGGLSALGAALFSIGIPKDSVLKYETAIKADKYLLVAQASAAEAARVKDVLSRTKPVTLVDHTLQPQTQAAAG
jgi:hypothetical protein